MDSTSQNKTAATLDAATQNLQAQRTRCEVWTRVMGYHRPVSSFNKGKQGEYAERMNFAESDAERC